MYGNVNTIPDETPYQTQPAPAGSEQPDWFNSGVYHVIMEMQWSSIHTELTICLSIRIKLQKT
jgi:hypothetical protein